jgi:betaine-aldehyde dehydrogenase
MDAEITRIPCADSAEVDAAVKAARDCFDSGSWSGLSAKQRGDLLRKLSQAVADNKERLAQIEMLHSGKPLMETRWDMDDVSTCFAYFADLAEKTEMEEKVDLPDADYSAVVFREPVGVVAAIVPWVCMYTCAQRMGCGVLLAPPTRAPSASFDVLTSTDLNPVSPFSSL